MTSDPTLFDDHQTDGSGGRSPWGPPAVDPTLTAPLSPDPVSGPGNPWPRPGASESLPPYAVPPVYPTPGYPAPTDVTPGYPTPPYPTQQPAAGTDPSYGPAQFEVPRYPAPYPGALPYPTYPAQNMVPPLGYPAPGYPPMGYPVARRTNALAILSLVFAFLFWPLGIVCGHIARRQIRRTGQAGQGLATAGLIVSYLYLALLIVIVAVAAGGH
jgi:hypothetical protein